MAAEAAFPPVETLTLADGAKIAYRVFGKEQQNIPLVLVNGLSSVMPDWGALVVALAKTRPVLIFDHRGIGESYLTPDEMEDITIELMADDLLALLRHINFTKVHVLGFSMGGMISQALVCHPEAKTKRDHVDIGGIEVHALVLAGTFCKSPKTSLSPKNMPNTEGLSHEERNRAIVETVMRLQYDEGSVDGAMRPMFQRRVELALSTRRPMMIVVNQSAAINMYSSRERLAELGAQKALRALIIHGRLDQVVDYSESEELARLLPNATRHFPAACPDGRFGHMWFEYFDVERDWVAPLVAWLDARDAHL
ncbi:hypothetical protein MCUN1_001711 [Malassezia cuniculi]|uniref:AB hydrolase-1 domain-containing protein n=1 Tax=Malassezia cuniculi TaxID=948313 RepID=A0AAF0EY75_9BASI|nr:hypothetical protein MCUN1_001711 [Malassezia cuniculi]